MLGLLRYVHSQLAKLSCLVSVDGALVGVQWVVVVQGANFLNYLSICTASSDDPLRAHRTRVNLRLERIFVNSYFVIKYTNCFSKFQNIDSCFKFQYPRK